MKRSTHATEVVTTWLRLSKGELKTLARFRHHGHTKMQAVCTLAANAAKQVPSKLSE